MEHAPSWAVALEASSFAFALRNSIWIYPAANLGHIFGLVLLAGSIIVLDLRVLGFARAIDIAALSRLVTPIAAFGFALQLATGSLLFTADASAMASNPVFWTKMGLLTLVIVNAIAFRQLWNSRLPAWDTASNAIARLQASVSMVLWLGIASAGRLIAYF